MKFTRWEKSSGFSQTQQGTSKVPSSCSKVKMAGSEIGFSVFTVGLACALASVLPVLESLDPTATPEVERAEFGGAVGAAASVLLSWTILAEFKIKKEELA